MYAVIRKRRRSTGASSPRRSSRAMVLRSRRDASSIPIGTSRAAARAIAWQYGISPRNTVAIIRNPLCPLPDALVSKMACSATGSITCTNGAYTAGSLYINSLFDPFGTSGAVQPRYWDQLSALYRNFTVYGCKVQIVVLKRAPYTDYVMRLLAYPNASSANNLASVFTDGREIRGTIFVDSVANGAQSSTVAIGPRAVSRYYDIGEIFGISKQELLSDLNYACSTSADPALTAYFFVAAQTYEGATTTTIYFEVRMEMWFKAYGLLPPASST